MKITMACALALSTAALAGPEDQISPAQQKAILAYWTKSCDGRNGTCAPAGVDLAKGTVEVTAADKQARTQDIAKLEGQKLEELGPVGQWYALYEQKCKPSHPFTYTVDIAYYKVQPGHVFDSLNAMTQKIFEGCTRTPDGKTWPDRDFMNSIKKVYLKADPAQLDVNQQKYGFDAATGTLTVKQFDYGIQMSSDQPWQSLVDSKGASGAEAPSSSGAAPAKTRPARHR